MIRERVAWHRYPPPGFDLWCAFVPDAQPRMPVLIYVGVMDGNVRGAWADRNKPPVPINSLWGWFLHPAFADDGIPEPV